MTRFAPFALLCLVSLSAPTLAQDSTGLAPPDASPAVVDASPLTVTIPHPVHPAQPTTVAQDPTDADVVLGAIKTAQDWRDLGWLAGLVALVNLLVRLLGYGRFNVFLASRGLKWVKPYLAMSLGAAGGFLTSFTTGATWQTAAVTGVLAGFAAVGAHEALNPRRKPWDQPGTGGEAAP